MIWSLYIDTYRSTLMVAPGEVYEGAGDHYLAVARRDPDTPIEIRPGGVYFNPFFKDGGSLHPYVVNGDNQMISIFTGRAPKKYPREKALMVARGWFELPPRRLTNEDIHPDLLNIIRHQPMLHGAIAQVARATMNMRIPEDLQVKSFDQWLAWITAQQTPLPLRLKTVFQLVSGRPQALIFSEKDTHRLLTGEEPEPQAIVKIRWYKYETVRVIRKQIKESVEWEMELPLSAIKEGEAAIVAAADAKFGADWRDLSGSVPTGATDTEPQSEAGEAIEGPLIWYRSAETNHSTFAPFGAKTSEADRPVSINDLFQIAIEST